MKSLNLWVIVQFLLVWVIQHMVGASYVVMVTNILDFFLHKSLQWNIVWIVST